MPSCASFASGSFQATAVVSVLGAVLLTPFPTRTYGQSLRVSRPSSTTLNSVTNIGQVGKTTVSSNFSRGLGFTAGRGTLPPQQSGQQLLGTGRRFSTFGRPQRGRRDLVGSGRAGEIRSSVRTNWRKRLATAGAARYMRQPPRFGLGGSPRVDRAVSSVLLEPQTLLNTTAFLGPVSGLGLPSGGIRDGMSASDQAGARPYTLLSLSAERQYSQSELMSSRLELLRERTLKEAWQWFKLEDFHQARAAFQSAEMLDRSDPETRAGIFFCSVAEERYSQALQNFNRIMRWDMRGARNSFDVDLRLAERYSSIRRMRADVRKLTEYNRRQKERTSLYGALCYALWHSGSQSEAVRGAQNLVKTDPTGPAGRLGRVILEAAKKHGVAAPE